MADKKVNLIISLKDGVSDGLSSIRSGIAKTTDAFKKIAVAGIGAATAIVGGLTMLAKSYAESEAAANKLSATFTALGENGAQAATKWGAFATEIQRVTTLDDEAVLGLVTLAKTMGVANDKIEGITKGAIGLSKAFGLDLNSAMKMSVLATQGQFEMLGRYIPALRSATTDAEKMAIVQQAMSTGFKVAQSELGTVSGAWAAFKNSVSDAKEVAGQAFFGDGSLTDGLLKVRQSIIEFTESGELTFWVNEIKNSFSSLADFIKPVGDKISKIVGGITGAVRDSGAWLGGFAGTLASGGNVKDAWKFAGESAKTAQSDFEARKQASMEEYQQKVALPKNTNTPAKAIVTNTDDIAKAMSGSEMQSVKGGFAELYEKMTKAGAEEYDKKRATRFVAEQEALGKASGVSGAGVFSAEQMLKGVDTYDAIRNTKAFIDAELKGKAAGVVGMGSFAKDMINSGSDLYDVSRAVSGAIGAEQTGVATSGGLTSPAEKTNKILGDMLKLHTDLLGGVKE